MARTVLTDSSRSLPGNPSPYRWVHGFDGITVTGNTAARRPDRCLRRRPPRSPHPHLGDRRGLRAQPRTRRGRSAGRPQPPGARAPRPCPRVAVPAVVPGVGHGTEGPGAVLEIPVRLTNASDQTVTARWTALSLPLPGSPPRRPARPAGHGRVRARSDRGRGDGPASRRPPARTHRGRAAVVPRPDERHQVAS
ncbi:MAG: hypothetical protein R2695_19255 [Acidimicrobiales bacterium]